ncbi:MAG: hypothetical protein QM726_00370 [Chitinophagaceae bacterium]
MKRSVKAGLFSFALIMLAQTAFSQTLKEFFNSDETTALYLGIDFTKTKIIDDANANEKDIVDRQYAGINEGAAADGKKETLATAFHKKIVDHDLGPVNKRNEKIDPPQIKSTNTADFHRLKEDDIVSLVKGFDYQGKKGLGILFVMEAMSKTNKAAAIWVTFIDMSSKKMLYTERIEEKVGMGFGFKNYWVIPVKRLLGDIGDDKYKEWQKKFQ